MHQDIIIEGITSPQSARNSVRLNANEMPSYEDLEQGILEGIAAIHSLTNERDNLRASLTERESELQNLRAANFELRLQMIRVGSSYVQFAESYADQLKLVGEAMQFQQESVPSDLQGAE